MLRLVGSGAVYVGVQGVIGMSTWPFVRRWYEDPALGLALRIPPPRVLLPFQLLRAIAGIAALLPLLLLVPHEAGQVGVRDWLELALLLSVTMGIVPLFAATRWPIALRLFHAAEITVIATLWSGLIVWIGLT